MPHQSRQARARYRRSQARRAPRRRAQLRAPVGLRPLGPRPWALAAALALVATLALSACGGSHTAKNANAGSSSTSAATTSPAPSSSSTSTSPGQEAAAAQNDPATIVLPTGPAASRAVLATVSGAPVSAAEVGALMQVQSSGKGPVPDPPAYGACIAHLKEEAQTGASSEAAELKGKSEAQLKQSCEQRYETLLRAALGRAIHNRWLLGEGRELRVHVGEREVQEEFQASKKSFANDAQFEAYMKNNGLTVPAMKQEIKLGKLSDGIFAVAKSKAHAAGAAQVSAFYAAHRQQFAVPAGRHVRIVRTATGASAQTALSELRAGKSFAAVAKELSAIAQPITAKNGEVKDLKPHVYEEKVLNDAIFNAKPNKLYGPLKVTAKHKTIASETNSGFFIFEVKGTVPGRQTPLSEVKAQIAEQLTTEQKNKSLAAFVAAFRRRWISRTDCHPGYVLVDLCKQFKGAGPRSDPYTL